MPTLFRRLSERLKRAGGLNRDDLYVVFPLMQIPTASVESDEPVGGELCLISSMSS
jgi:hypothetical protein